MDLFLVQYAQLEAAFFVAVQKSGGEAQSGETLEQQSLIAIELRLGKAFLQAFLWQAEEGRKGCGCARVHIVHDRGVWQYK